MKATGIVRRIDDLGRVVIPKEIRRTMRIREGDPLEIYTERDGEVIFKKYSPLGELGEFAVSYAETLSKTMGIPTVITDRDSIIAVSGVSKKELLEKRVSSDIENLMTEKESFVSQGFDSGISIAEGNDSIFETNIFGKTVRQLIEDGIDEKISKISSESREKLQTTMQKIVNDSNRGFICIII